MPNVPVVLAPVVSGLPLSGSDLNNNWWLVEQSFLGQGGFVVSGLVPTAGAGLSVNISSGTAVVGVYQSLAAFVIGSLTNGTTNYLFLNENGTGTHNMTGVQPAATAFLGTAVTAGGVVTAVTVAPKGRWRAIATKTAAYQMSVFDYCILANGAGGGFTVGLPSAVGIPGQELIVKKIDTTANVITVAAAGGQFIDNAASVAMSTPYTSLTLISDGANFWIT